MMAATRGPSPSSHLSPAAQRSLLPGARDPDMVRGSGGSVCAAAATATPPASACAAAATAPRRRPPRQGRGSARAWLRRPPQAPAGAVARRRREPAAVGSSLRPKFVFDSVSIWLFRLEPEPNRNNRNRNLSVPISKKNRSVPIFLEPNFPKNRGTEPIGSVKTERPALPSPNLQ